MNTGAQEGIEFATEDQDAARADDADERHAESNRPGHRLLELGQPSFVGQPPPADADA